MNPFKHLRRTHILLASGLLFTLSFSPISLGFMVYFSLALLLYGSVGLSPGRGFTTGYLWGLLTNSLLLFWIGWATIPGAFGAVIALSLYPGLFLFCLRFVGRRSEKAAVAAFPFLWVAVEYIRGLGQIAFPWLDIAYTQTPYLKLVQFADITGVYGVSFFVASVSVVVYLAFASSSNLKRLILWGILVVGFLIPWLYGSSAMSEEEDYRTIRVGLLQGNIGQDIKWNPDYTDSSFTVFYALSDSVVKRGAQLVVWPETAAPCYLRHDFQRVNYMKKVVRDSGVPFLVGSPEYKKIGPSDYVYYNSAFYLSPDGRFDEYSKIHLVPFSERIPFSGRIKVLKDIHLGQADFSPGNKKTIFRHPAGDFGVLICFESAFAELARDFIHGGADFLVNITNDQWFGYTHGPYQHANIVILRAIENRVGVARCANTGFTMLVDPKGRVHQKDGLFVRRFLVGDVALRSRETFFTAHGNYFPKIITVLAMFFLAWALIAARFRFPPRVAGGPAAARKGQDAAN